MDTETLTVEGAIEIEAGSLFLEKESKNTRKNYMKTVQT